MPKIRANGIQLYYDGGALKFGAVKPALVSPSDPKPTPPATPKPMVKATGKSKAEAEVEAEEAKPKKAGKRKAS